MTGEPRTLNVCETFGPTIQGEGPSTGTPAYFVRLGRCNLTCTWCDTPYSWNWDEFDPAEEIESRTVAAVVDEVLSVDVPLVVITGGEPMLQRSALLELCSDLSGKRRVEIETNGTLAPSFPLTGTAVEFRVSPKLQNSGVEESRRLNVPALEEFALLAERGQAAFKFVASDVRDLEEIQGIVAQCDAPRSSVWVMAEARTAEQLVRPDLVEATVLRGWNVSTRLQVLTWGDERGV